MAVLQSGNTGQGVAAINMPIVAGVYRFLASEHGGLETKSNAIAGVDSKGGNVLEGRWSFVVPNTHFNGPSLASVYSVLPLAHVHFPFSFYHFL